VRLVGAERMRRACYHGVTMDARLIPVWQRKRNGLLA
jgi:hypothetical protein